MIGAREFERGARRARRHPGPPRSPTWISRLTAMSETLESVTPGIEALE